MRGECKVDCGPISPGTDMDWAAVNKGRYQTRQKTTRKRNADDASAVDIVSPFKLTSA